MRFWCSPNQAEPLEGHEFAQRLWKSSDGGPKNNFICRGVGRRSASAPTGDGRSASPTIRRRRLPQANDLRRSAAGLAGILLAIWVGSGVAGGVAAGEASLEGKRFSVEARMEHGDGGPVQAKLVPGEFKIPEGYQAAQITYRFYDPKSGRELKHIGPQTIYSLAEKRYIYKERMEELTLKAGEYRLAIGGQPGAVGVLSYTLERAAPPLDEKLAAEADRIIEVVSWVKHQPKVKTPAIYYISGRKVVGKMDHVQQAFDPNPNFQAEPQQVKGDFVGQIEGDVITGQWKIQTGPFRCKITDSATGRVGGRTDMYRSTFQIRLTLNPDGSISESVTGQSESTMEYDAAAIEMWQMKESKQVHRSNFSSETDKVEIEGAWKELAKPKKPK